MKPSPKPMKVKKRKPLANAALAPWKYSLGFGAAGAALTTIAVAYVVLSGGPLIAVVCGAILLWTGVGTIVTVRRRRRDLEAELRWLRERPCPIANVDHYIEKLGERRQKSKVSVRAMFRDNLSPAEQERVGDAALGLLRTGRASCTGSRLQFDIVLKSFEPPPAGRTEGSRYTNEYVHSWFKKVVAIIETIHEEHPVVRIRVEIEDVI